MQHFKGVQWQLKMNLETAQHLSFIIWILVILFYAPLKENIVKYQSKLILD